MPTISRAKRSVATAGWARLVVLVLRSCRNDLKVACQKVIGITIRECKLKSLQLGKDCRIGLALIIAPIITQTPNTIVRGNMVAMLGKQGAQFLRRIDLH